MNNYSISLVLTCVKHCLFVLKKVLSQRLRLLESTVALKGRKRESYGKRGYNKESENRQN